MPFHHSVDVEEDGHLPILGTLRLLDNSARATAYPNPVLTSFSPHLSR